jgi:hypothetical protein
MNRGFQTMQISQPQHLGVVKYNIKLKTTLISLETETTDILRNLPHLDSIIKVQISSLEAFSGPPDLSSHVEPCQKSNITIKIRV